MCYVVDINECTIPDKLACDQICTNINGSFICSCKDGYTLAINKFDCISKLIFNCIISLYDEIFNFCNKFVPTGTNITLYLFQ